MYLFCCCPIDKLSHLAQVIECCSKVMLIDVCVEDGGETRSNSVRIVNHQRLYRNSIKELSASW